MARHGSDPLDHGTHAGAPDQVGVTVVACLVILLVFIVIALLV